MKFNILAVVSLRKAEPFCYHVTERHLAPFVTRNATSIM